MDTQSLKTYIETLVERGSSASELSRKCGISNTAMSQFRSGKYGANEAALAGKIATALNYYENAWNVVRSVTSYRQVHTAFLTAKAHHRWVCISSRSGSGKTQSLVDLYNVSGDNSVIYLKCRKWTAHKFLTKLALCMGQPVPSYMDNDSLTDLIIAHLNRLAPQKPVLILDDAGKLTHSALCTLIPLYDDTLHRVGALVAGTETLERNIKRYVGRIEGYDEIDGRFNRNYINLLGASRRDVIAVCQANGITSAEKQEFIWGKLRKTKKEPSEGSGKHYWFTDDLRELSGIIEAELIRQQIERGELR